MGAVCFGIACSIDSYVLGMSVRCVSGGGLFFNKLEV